MPELPEVETVARDLRGLVVGARIAEVRVSWLKTLRSQDEGAFAEAVVGRAIVGTSRRAKLVVLDLDGGLGADREALPDDGAAITIHLKMTGQLFVVRADQPEDPYVRLVMGFEDGPSSASATFGSSPVGVARRDPSTGDLSGELGGPRTFKGFGPEPLDPGSRLGSSRAGSARGGPVEATADGPVVHAGVGNIYADEALWAARLHPLRSASPCDRATARGCTAS